MNKLHRHFTVEFLLRGSINSPESSFCMEREAIDFAVRFQNLTVAVANFRGVRNRFIQTSALEQFDAFFQSKLQIRTDAAQVVERNI